MHDRGCWRLFHWLGLSERVSGKLPTYLAYAALFEIYGPNSFWLGTFLGLCMNKYSSKKKIAIAGAADAATLTYLTWTYMDLQPLHIIAGWILWRCPFSSLPSAHLQASLVPGSTKFRRMDAWQTSIMECYGMRCGTDFYPNCLAF